MRTYLSFISVLMIIGMIACTSAAKKEQQSATPSDTTTVANETPAAPDYNPNTTDKEVAGIVATSLQQLFKEDLAKELIPTDNRKFIFYQYDLNGDGKKEIFVGLTGMYFCGSGGCTALLLTNAGKLIDTFTVVDYPIIIDTQKTNGWDNLLMMSNGAYHLMKFNGQKYPQNPSVEPNATETLAPTLPRVLDYLNEPYEWFAF